MSTISATQRTHHVALAGSRAVGGGSVSQFVQARADRTLGVLGGGRTAAPEGVTASQVYRRHGEVAHDLSSREEVGRLISRSPQLDNIASAGGDETRCGGAAMLNALLLDGNHEANASAIERLASSRHVDLSAREAAAVEAMGGGHLTPNQSAQLQSLLYRVADTGDRSHTGEGLSGVELSTTVGALTALGGFGNTSEVNFRNSEMGGGAHHWTVTSTTGEGTAHADSWPGSNGYARVAGGPGATGFTSAGRLDPSFTADVTVTRDLTGTRLRTRAAEGSEIQENTIRLQPSPTVLPARRLDGNTGAPIGS